MNNFMTRKLMFLACCTFFSWLYGCAGTDMYTGRQALLKNQPDVALGYFQRVADTEPNYVLHFTIVDEGVWTYLGRAQYLTGNLMGSRQSLEKAVAQDNNDYLAKLYLGMTLARDNDQPGGLQQIQSGMEGIHDRIQFVIDNRIGTGDFWDPRGEIRSEIKKDLAMIDGKEIQWEKLLSSGEWIGQQVEEEIHQAENDWINDVTADNGV